MVANLRVCTHCGYHFSVTSRERIVQLTDEGSWSEIAAHLRSADPLAFVDSKPYPERLADAESATGLADAVLVGTAAIGDLRVALSVMDFTFMGGSMGAVVGEKFARAADAAVAERIPLVSVSSSGGARMQEGVLALMQMAKTVAAVDELREAGLPFISILAHPTTGGVAASFAALGDVIIAEPGALLSFSGPRVVKQTTRESVPDDFGLAESNQRHGHVDVIVPAARAARHGGERDRAALGRHAVPVALDLAGDSGRDGAGDVRCQAAGGQRLPAPKRRRHMTTAERRFPFLRRRGPDSESWHAVQLARHQDRPYTLDYLERITDDFLELHGDQAEGDDPAIVAGIGSFRGQSVAFVGHQKGRDLKQRTYRNFGMPRPEGYRKAMRVFGLAARLNFPVVTLIDTPGRLPRCGGRAAGAVGRDRAIAADADGVGGAGGRVCDRRGLVGWRPGDRGGRSRADAATLDLHGDLAGGLRRDPLEGRRRGPACGRRAAPHRRRLPAAGCGRCDRARAVRRRPQGSHQGGGVPGRRDLGGARVAADHPAASAAGAAAAQVPRDGCVGRVAV